MDIEDILNSFNYKIKIKYSKAIKIGCDELYFVYKIEIIDITNNSSKTKNKIKKLFIKSKEKNEILLSNLNIEPVAYILKTKIIDNNINDVEYKNNELKDNNNSIDNEIKNKEYKYSIKPIDEENKEYIEKNENRILKEFLKNKN